jgi:hypothetical protein
MIDRKKIAARCLESSAPNRHRSNLQQHRISVPLGATLINSPPAAIALSAARAAARSFPRRRAAIQKFGASPLSRTHALGRLL